MMFFILKGEGKIITYVMLSSALTIVYSNMIQNQSWTILSQFADSKLTTKLKIDGIGR